MFSEDFGYPFVNPFESMLPEKSNFLDSDNNNDHDNYTGVKPLPASALPFQNTDNFEDVNVEERYVETQIQPAQVINNPPPILSNNPPVASVVLFKELTGYPNYGNPSRNADILYTRNRGTWTFDTPAFLLVAGNLRPQLTIRAVLDDHSQVPVNRYSLRITINGVVVHNGRVNLPHGAPAGGMFTNWRELIFNVPNIRRTTTITIENTSNTGPNDWIAFDWMELRLLPRSGGR
jgi:hypothetical protein